MIGRCRASSRSPGSATPLDDLAEVTSPPYDVIDAAERAQLCARHEHNVVRIDLSGGGSRRDRDPYVDAATTFVRWQREGVLTEDAPSFYPYRMTFTDEAGVRRQTLGVLGALGLGADERRDVLPHEHTTPKAKSDRHRLLQTTRANLSAIWGLSLTPGLTARIGLDRACALGSWTDDEGVLHELWRLDDPAAVQGGARRGERDVAGDRGRPSPLRDLPDLRGRGGAHRRGSAATLCLVVELDERAADRRADPPVDRGLPAGFDVVAALDPFFVAGDLEPMPDGAVVGRLVAEGALGLVTPDGFRLLRADDAALMAAGAEGGASMLDSVRISTALADLPAHELTYQHGVAHAVAAVQEGHAQAAVLLRPVSVEQIRLTAYSRGRMPPKSTFFWPKPRTGAVFRSFD